MLRPIDDIVFYPFRACFSSEDSQTLFHKFSQSVVRTTLLTATVYGLYAAGYTFANLTTLPAISVICLAGAAVSLPTLIIGAGGALIYSSIPVLIQALFTFKMSAFILPVAGIIGGLIMLQHHDFQLLRIGLVEWMIDFDNDEIS